MNDLLYLEEDGATPLTSDERKGLILTHVTLRRELNELEQKNIFEADSWAFQRKRNVLDEGFLRGFHRRMFSNVWSWAGEYRTTERNLGVAPWKIQPKLHQIIDDVRYWIEHQTYSPDEIDVRFHHRLVAVHTFPNGNGRWSRLAADILVVSLGSPRFTWGRANLQTASDVRKQYIDALHAADDHDLMKLIAFARS
jgi:Fic-DOC domain mobile mystery protein B